jgi:DNA-binding GntR family transcriptional regulator
MNPMPDATTVYNPPPTKSKVSELVGRIEHDISLGILGSGTWLKQVDLEATYKCPRIDLREALDRLSEKGLVRLESNRGYRVSEIDERRLSQILHVRAVLEVEAATEILALFPDEDLPQLEDLAQHFSFTVENGNVIEQEESNRCFHAKLLHCCTNTELVKLIFELRNRAPLTINRRKNTNARLVQSAREHFQMIDCLRSRDLRLYCKILKHHVLGELTSDTASGEGAKPNS